MTQANIERTDCDNCHKCLEGKTVDWGFVKVPVTGTRMIGCVECGNKRCPKASDHMLKCTNSNEPGQPGSIYALISSGISVKE